MTDPMALPEPGIEHQLAARLLGKQDRLDLDILERLVGQPRRYRDLKPLLGGRGDHTLTKALERLKRDGLVDRGFELGGASPERFYCLTELGVLVVFRVHEMVPVAASLDAARRGGLVPA